MLLKRNLKQYRKWYLKYSFRVKWTQGGTFINKIFRNLKRTVGEWQNALWALFQSHSGRAHLLMSGWEGSKYWSSWHRKAVLSLTRKGTCESNIRSFICWLSQLCFLGTSMTRILVGQHTRFRMTDCSVEHIVFVLCAHFMHISCVRKRYSHHHLHL